MALVHATSGDIVNVRPLGSELASASSRAILKSNDLEIMRLVLQAGKSMPEHCVPGEVTLHCIEGTVEVQAHGKTQVLRAGDMMYLRGGEPHAVKALEDASLLHTILLKRDADGALSGHVTNHKPS